MMSNNNENKLDKVERIQKVLGESNQCVILKGQLLNPAALTTKDGSSRYYTFDLKVLKTLSDDSYGQYYDMMHFVVPVESAKNFTEQFFTDVKGNEVMILGGLTCKVKRVPGQNPGETINFNNASFFADEILLVNRLEKKNTAARVVNL